MTTFFISMENFIEISNDETWERVGLLKKWDFIPYFSSQRDITWIIYIDECAFKFNWRKKPLIAIQCLWMTLDFMLNVNCSTIRSIRLNFHQMDYISIQYHLHSSMCELIFCFSLIFVSWMNTNTSSWAEIIFLSKHLLGLALRPRMFHEINDIILS